MTRSRRRLLVWLASGALALPLLAFAVLHVPAVQRRLAARALLAVRERVGLQIDAARISFSPTRLAVTADDVRVAAVEVPERPLLRAAHLELDIARSTLTTRGQEIALDALVLDQPVVRLQRDASGQWNLPAADPDAESTPLPRLSIEDLRVTGGRVEVDDRVDDWRVVLTDLRVADAEDGFALTAGLDAQIADASVDGAVDGRLRLEGDALEVPELTVRSGASDLRASGRVDLREATLAMTTRLDLQVRDVAALLDVPDAAGRLTSEATVTGPFDAPSATWTLTGDALTDGQAPPVTLNASGHADASAVRIDSASAETAGGRLVVDDSVVTFADAGTTRVRASLSDVGLGPWLDAYAPGAALTGRLGGSIAVEGPGLDWQAWDATLRLQARDLAVPQATGVRGVGTLSARADSGRWTADAALQVPDMAEASVDLRGEVTSALDAATIAGSARIDVQDVDAIATAWLDAPDAVEGQLSLEANVRGTLAEPVARWQLDGALGSPYVADTSVAARGRMSPAAIVAEEIALEAGPNRAAATATVRLEGAQPIDGRLTATLPRLDALIPPGAAGTWMAATGGGRVDARLAGTLSRPTLTADVALQDLEVAGQDIERVTLQARVDGPVVRVTNLDVASDTGGISGSLQVDLARETHVAALALTQWPVSWQLPAGTPTAAAAPTPTDASAVQLRDDAASRELSTVVSGTLTTQGPWTTPSGSVTLHLPEVRYEGIEVSAFDLSATSDGRRVSLYAEAPALQTSVDGTLALQGARLFEATATLDGLTLEPVRPWIPAALQHLEGSIVASLGARGSLDAPVDTTTVQATVTTLGLSMDEARVVLDGPARIAASARSVVVDSLTLRSGGLSLSASGALAGDAGTAPLTVRLTGGLDAIEPWARALEISAPPLSGRIDVDATLAGSFDAPRPAADLVLNDVAVQFAGTTLELPVLHARLADGILTLEDTTARWGEAVARGQGRLPLSLLRPVTPDALHVWLGQASGPARVEARATDLRPAVLEPFVGPAALDGIDGTVSATLLAEATSPDWTGLEATLTLDEASFTLQGIPIAQARPTVARLDDGVLEVKDALFSGVNTDLAIDGIATLAGEAPTLDAQLRGLTDLALLRPFSEGVAPGGRAEIDLRAAGPLTAPEIDGQLVLTDASLRVAEPRLALEQLDGTARFEGRRMTVAGLRGFANGAPLTLTADVSLTAENEPQGTVSVRANAVPLEYPEGFRVEADVDVRAALQGTRIDVTGDVAVLRGAYRDPIALSALSTSLLVAETPTLTGLDTGGGYDVRFGIDLDIRDDIIVDNNYGRLAVGGSVRLIGTLAAPALSGRLTVEEGGELYLGGLTYRVERGAVDFANPTRIEPIVDLAAETRAGGERIRIEASGAPDDLEVTLSAPEASEPLSQAELASLLVSGRGLDDLSGTAAGEQLLAVLSADLLGLVGRGVGLDAIRLDRDLLLDDRANTGEADIAAETDPVARLTLVKRIRANVEVLFSQNLRDANAITWLVTWKPFRRVEARLLQRDDRSMSYEFRHEIVFGAPAVPSRSRATRPRITAVTLTVDSAPRAPIPDPRSAIHDALEDRLSLERGDRFDFYRWQQDRDRLAAWLFERGYFEHRLTARRATSDGEDGPVVALTYDVRLGSQGRLDVDGFALDASVRDRMRDAWRGLVFDGFLAADLTRIAREAMLEQGHPLAEIATATALEDDGRTKVTRVTIDPGPRVEPVVVSTGVPAPLDAAFAEWLEAGRSALAWVDPEALADRAAEWLQQHGALTAEASVSEAALDGAHAVRTVQVSQADLFTLDDLTLDGVAAARDAAARNQLGLSPGAAFTSERISTAARDLERWYLSEGFRDVDVQVTTDVDAESNAVDLTVRVDEGPRAVVAVTHIDGREHTQTALLERALSLPIGEPVSPSALLAARKRLYDTGVVASADVRVDDAGDVEVRPDGTRIQPVAVTGVVRELPRLRFRYGLAVYDDVLQDDVLRASETRRVTPGLSALLEHRNLFGRAIVSGLSARYERARQSGRTFLTLPSILRHVGRLQASAGITRSRLQPDRTDSPIDLRTDASVGVTQGLPGLAGLRWTYGYRYERSRTYDPQNLDLFDITITAPRLTSTVFVDRRDDPTAPTRGWLHASTVELSRGWLGSDFEFAKYYAQQSAFRPIGDIVLAGRAQVGLGRGFGGQDLVGSERFSAGGAASVRGYGESVIGEVDSILGIARGDGLVVLNGEVRFPVWRWVSAVGFLDAGGVYPRVGDINWGDLLWGTGAGVRVSTPAGLVRVDLGLPLSRRPTDKAWRVYVGLGQIF